MYINLFSTTTETCNEINCQLDRVWFQDETSEWGSDNRRNGYILLRKSVKSYEKYPKDREEMKEKNEVSIE